jgi:ech hydrogenase subunit A
MLIVFHAVSKALLFLCVGTTKQRIGSQDIEKMRGLYGVMPRTALIMAIGIVTMMLPPFGMLLSKWIALESALLAGPAMPALVVFIALGSALTVLFWGRWAGSLLGAIAPSLTPPAESQECSVRLSLYSLTAGAVVLSLAAPLLYLYVILPIGFVYAKGDISALLSPMSTTYGVCAVYAIFILLSAGAVWAWKEAKRSQAATEGKTVLPYMSGLQVYQDGKMGFVGPMQTFVESDVPNYYLRNLFGERRLTVPANTVAIVLIALFLFGGAL